MNRVTLMAQARQLLRKSLKSSPRRLLLCRDDNIAIPDDFVGTILNFRLREGELYDKETNKWSSQRGKG
jgi:hypothetical protein